MVLTPYDFWPDPFQELLPIPTPPSNDAMTEFFDVIVSGAGPVGLLLGFHLFYLGLSIALINPPLQAGTGGSKAFVIVP